MNQPVKVTVQNDEIERITYALRVAAAWIERMRGEADDADVAWCASELRRAEQILTAMQAKTQ